MKEQKETKETVTSYEENQPYFKMLLEMARHFGSEKLSTLTDTPAAEKAEPLRNVA